MSARANMEAVSVETSGEARSALYSLFARSLSHPSEEILEALASQCFESDVRTLALKAGYDLPEGKSFGPPDSPDVIKTLYTSAFEAGLPKASLREASYVREGEKALFEDLFRFYDHFGLDTSSGRLREWPDHVAVELEFMHYLTWLEVGASENTASLRLAQKDFLSRHLGQWVRELAENLEEKDIAPPYALIARLLADVVAAEISLLQHQ